MEALASDWKATHEATAFLVGLEPGDKLSVNSGEVRVTPPGFVQSIFRTFSGESREVTYTYAATAIESFVGFLNRLLEHIRFHGKKDSTVKGILESAIAHASSIDGGLDALEQTYSSPEALAQTRTRLNNSVRLFTTSVAKF
jgi:hypothetical protein